MEVTKSVSIRDDRASVYFKITDNKIQKLVISKTEYDNLIIEADEESATLLLELMQKLLKEQIVIDYLKRVENRNATIIDVDAMDVEARMNDTETKVTGPMSYMSVTSHYDPKVP
jgi:hypothetical protein